MLGNNNSNSVAKGTFSLSIAVLLTKILGVIYKIPLSYILGDEGMGYFNSAYTLYGFFYIISAAGLPKSVTMVITENTVDKEKRYSIFNYLIKLSVLTGLVLSGVFFILSPAFSYFLGSKSTLMSLMFIAPSILFVAVSGVVRGYLNANMNFIPIAIAQVIEGAVKLVVGLGLALLGKKLLLPLEAISGLTVLGITIGSLLSLVFMLKFTKNRETGYKPRQNCCFDKKETIKKIVKIATPITLSSALVSLGSVFDLAIISTKLQKFGYTENQIVALYGNYTTLAVPMINLVVSILTPISVALLPSILSARVQENPSAIEQKLVSTLYITASLAAPCAMVFFFYPLEILDVLFDGASAALGAPLLSVLSFSAFLLPVLTVLNTGLEALGRIKASLASISVSVLFKFILSMLTVGNSKFGIAGIPISTTLSYSLSLITSIFLISKEKISLKSICSCIFPFIFAFLSFYTSYSLFGYNKHQAGILKAALISIISCIIYALLIFIWFSILKIKAKFVKNAQLVK